MAALEQPVSIVITSSTAITELEAKLAGGAYTATIQGVMTIKSFSQQEVDDGQGGTTQADQYQYSLTVDDLAVTA